MTYPFVPAAAKYGLRKAPVKAFIVHMAEGGGTVGFLAKPNARGVSVHYVVESTGRIVQMVREIEATGSINPNDIRTTDDADGFYGATVAKAVMGDWWKDPNSAAITCEVEGFAQTGPNAAQHGSLKALSAEFRTRYPGIGLLGHRDFQDYKACPGKLVHWDDIGGHGPAQEEVDVEATVEFAPVPFAIIGTAKSFGATAPYPPLSDLTGTVQVDATVLITQTATPHGPFVRVVTGTTGRRIIPIASGAFATGADVTHEVVLTVDGAEKAKVAV